MSEAGQTVDSFLKGFAEDPPETKIQIPNEENPESQLHWAVPVGIAARFCSNWNRGGHSRRNGSLVLEDDVGWKELGCYGSDL